MPETSDSKCRLDYLQALQLSLPSIIFYHCFQEREADRFEGFVGEAGSHTLTAYSPNDA